MKCIQECAEEEYIQENGSVLSSKCLLIINSMPGKNEEEALGKKKTQNSYKERHTLWNIPKHHKISQIITRKTQLSSSLYFFLVIQVMHSYIYMHDYVYLGLFFLRTCLLSSTLLVHINCSWKQVKNLLC